MAVCSTAAMAEFQTIEINFRTNPFTLTSGTATLVSGSFNDGTHGYYSAVVSVALEAGNYKITVGNCQHSNQPGSLKNADGSATLDLLDANGQTITSFTTPKNCYDDTEEKTTSVWYIAGEDQTVRVVCPQYTPYLKVEKVESVPGAKTMYTVSFTAGEAQGVAPEAIEVEAGLPITIPVNRSLYKEGYTLACWTDGGNYYAPNTGFIPAGNVELEPVFSANTVELLTATEEVTVKWFFGESNGAPSLALNSSKGNGLLVTQATIGDKAIDVKLDIDANTGKFNNVGRGDEWSQVNNTTYFVFPAKKDAEVTTRCYNEPANSLVDGAAYTSWAGNVATYVANPTGDISQLENHANTYYSYLQIVLPASAATALENTAIAGKAQKVVRDGQVLIVREGKTYNALGVEVK